MRLNGLLKSWNDERGFGFIEPLESGEDIFVHIKAFRFLVGRPQIGQALSFEVEPAPEGRKRAKNVEPITRISKSKRRASPRLPGTATLLALPLFLILYVVVGVLWEPPLVIAAVYVGASFMTYFVYAIDKSAAQRNARRTPEKTLHLLALAGGWPGALIAQEILRHKSIKTEFRSSFWTTVVLNAVVFVVLSSPIGQSLWLKL